MTWNYLLFSYNGGEEPQENEIVGENSEEDRE